MRRVHWSLALLSFSFLVACMGTETGNPNRRREGVATLGGYSSDPLSVSVLAPGGTIALAQTWVSAKSLQLLGCDTAQSVIAETTSVRGEVLRQPLRLTFKTSARSVCGARLSLTPSTDASIVQAPELAQGATLVVAGNRADGVPIRLVSTTAQTLVVNTTKPIEFDASVPLVQALLDVALWFADVNWSTAEVNASGAIQIDAVSNVNILTAVEQNLTGSLKLEATFTCNDSILNGDETGIDCGGSCGPCLPSLGRVRSLSTVAAAPLRVLSPSAAYHGRLGLVMAYGGQSADGSNSGGLWQFDGSTWTVVNTSPQPSGRADTTLVYDSQRDVLVLFGGAVGSSQGLVYTSLSNELWEWSLGSGWVQRNIPNGPPPLAGAFAAYDELRKRMVLFGGLSSDPSQPSTQLDSWVWEYDGSQWYGPYSPDVRPSGRRTIGQAAAFVDGNALNPDIRNKVVFWSGYTTYPDDEATPNDAWAWDGATWTQVCNPCTSASRAGAGFAYDAGTGLLLALGGWNGAEIIEISGTDALGASGAWSVYDTTFPAIDGMGCVYNRSLDAVITVGGNGPSCFSNDGALSQGHFPRNCNLTHSLR